MSTSQRHKGQPSCIQGPSTPARPIPLARMMDPDGWHIPRHFFFLGFYPNHFRKRLFPRQTPSCRATHIMYHDFRGSEGGVSGRCNVLGSYPASIWLWTLFPVPHQTINTINIIHLLLLLLLLPRSSKCRCDCARDVLPFPFCK